MAHYQTLHYHCIFLDLQGICIASAVPSICMKRTLWPSQALSKASKIHLFIVSFRCMTCAWSHNKATCGWQYLGKKIDSTFYYSPRFSYYLFPHELSLLLLFRTVGRPILPEGKAKTAMCHPSACLGISRENMCSSGEPCRPSINCTVAWEPATPG